MLECRHSSHLASFEYHQWRWWCLYERCRLFSAQFTSIVQRIHHTTERSISFGCRFFFMKQYETNGVRKPKMRILLPVCHCRLPIGEIRLGQWREKDCNHLCDSMCTVRCAVILHLDSYEWTCVLTLGCFHRHAVVQCACTHDNLHTKLMSSILSFLMSFDGAQSWH